MTIRLPETVYEALRREAFRRRISMNEIIAEALREHQDAGGVAIRSHEEA